MRFNIDRRTIYTYLYNSGLAFLYNNNRFSLRTVLLPLSVRTDRGKYTAISYYTTHHNMRPYEYEKNYYFSDENNNLRNLSVATKVKRT